MKSLFNNIQFLLIVVLAALLFYQRSCSSPEPVEPKVIVETVTKYDTVETIKTEYVPKWRTRIETIHDTIPSDIDTAAILRDYYLKYFYTDTMEIDTIGYAVVSDTISRNTIISRDFKSNIFIPTITLKKTVYINENEWYWGLGIQGTASQLNYLGGQLLYRTKKKNAYGFGIGVNQEFNPVFSGTLYWRLNK